MQSLQTNIGSRMALLKSSVNFNLAPSQDATFATFASQFIKFLPCQSCPVNCKCCYCEVEMSWSNNSSAVKWQATQAHRTAPPMLKCIACKNHLSSVATLTTKFQTASGSNVSKITVTCSFMKWVSMSEQPHTNLSLGWSGVTPGNHVFDVFDTIPLILQSLPRTRCHQPPVMETFFVNSVVYSL